MGEANVIDPRVVAFHRGQRDYLARRPCPPKDFDENGPIDEPYAAWLGWMYARGSEFMAAQALEERCHRIKLWAEEGAPLP